MRSRILGFLVLFSLLLNFAACQSPDEKPGVWFVHATDPHLYYDLDKKIEESVRLYQERLNRQAFSDLIQSLRSIPGTDGKPQFLLLTGDLGLDRLASEPTLRESAVSFVAEQLKASPVKNVYLVLGNNDVAGEAPQGPAVDAAASFFVEVQNRLVGSGVELHDLTSCYRDKSVLPSGCHVDIPGTSFRLIGFASYSFKNKNGAEVNQAVQEAQLQQFATLIKEAAAQGKQTLVATHIPELDDPYPLGLNLWQGKPEMPQQGPPWAPFSAWKVSPGIYQSWKNIVDSEDVAGVLAGHFHDSHREIYYPPYSWSKSPPERADLRKLFLAPPLSVKVQDTSPIQARGFAIFHLDGGHIERRLFWYDPVKRNFRGDPVPSRSVGSRHPFAKAAAWLWQAPLEKLDISRAVIIAIAFLAAFLTVAQLWEVAPPASRTPSPGGAMPGQPTQPPANSNPFLGNFAKTVLAGLGGMLALDFLSPIWSLQDINCRVYYVVLFVIFFFSFLILQALLQGAVEALRCRIATRQQPVLPHPWLARRHGDCGLPSSVTSEKPTQEGFARKNSAHKNLALTKPPLIDRFWAWLAYWQNRIWRWFLSLRTPILIFLDTFFNVLRGQNKLHTKIFEGTIIDLHWSLVRAAERIQEDVRAVIMDRSKIGKTGEIDVLVNVVVLSEDESMLFFLLRERGSFPPPFDKNSIAWLAVYTGEARWYKRSYGELKEVVVLDNTSNTYSFLPMKKILLDGYNPERLSPDYEAFLILPIPWRYRGIDPSYRKGAILLAFRNASELQAIWPSLDGDSNYPDYKRWNKLLDPLNKEQGCEGCLDAELRAVLHQALGVLGELLRSFNDSVFENYIKANPRLDI